MDSTIELGIAGMDCAECATHIEKAVGALPGVKQARVSLAAERAIIRYDAALVDLPAMAQAVRAAGYGIRGEEKRTSRQPLADRLGLAFGAVVALLVLVAVVGEALGLLDAVLERLPAPIFLAAVLLGGWPIYVNVWRALRSHTVTSHALMTLGVIAAILAGQPATAVVIVLFMRVGQLMEDYTTERSRDAIRALVAIAPQTAIVERDGAESEVPVAQVAPGDTVVLRPGTRIPVDGVVSAGLAGVDQAAITGESMPVEKGPGDRVYAATVVQGGYLKVQAARTGNDTTFGRIIRLVEDAEAAKAPVQRFADRFTAYYIPLVLLAAALTFLITRQALNAVAVLVVACACAVALATPMAVLASVGQAAKRGILIKGGLYLEGLARVDTLLMDKTGTLTFGKPVVTDVLPLRAGQNADDLLRLAAGADRFSEHPLAAAVVRAARERGLALTVPERFAAIAGRGVTATVDGQHVLVGNLALMQEHAVAPAPNILAQVAGLEAQGKTVLLVAAGREGGPAVVGLLALADVLREEVPAALAELRDLGIRRLILLTGDNERVAAALSRQLGIEYRAGLLPEDKIAVVRQLQAEGRRVAMIGDGVNDAPALAAADVGLAMGAGGADVALAAADVALLRDDWRAVPAAVRISRRAFATIRENLILASLYNIVGIGLASVGILPPMLAAAAQSLPDVAILLNSSKLLRGKE